MVDNQGLGTLYERMPQRDGTRDWAKSKVQDTDNKQEFEDYLTAASARTRTCGLSN
jgi:hypothetical protein